MKRKIPLHKTHKLLFLSPNYAEEEVAMAAIYLQNYLLCLLHTISECDTNSGSLILVKIHLRAKLINLHKFI